MSDKKILEVLLAVALLIGCGSSFGLSSYDKGVELQKVDVVGWFSVNSGMTINVSYLLYNPSDKKKNVTISLDSLDKNVTIIHSSMQLDKEFEIDRWEKRVINIEFKDSVFNVSPHKYRYIFNTNLMINGKFAQTLAENITLKFYLDGAKMVYAPLDHAERSCYEGFCVVTSEKHNMPPIFAPYLIEWGDIPFYVNVHKDVFQRSNTTFEVKIIMNNTDNVSHSFQLIDIFPYTWAGPSNESGGRGKIIRKNMTLDAMETKEYVYVLETKDRITDPVMFSPCMIYWQEEDILLYSNSQILYPQGYTKDIYADLIEEKNNICGDNVCEGGENYTVCSADCKNLSVSIAKCGNRICEKNETPENCLLDCPAELVSDNSGRYLSYVIVFVVLAIAGFFFYRIAKKGPKEVKLHIDEGVVEEVKKRLKDGDDPEELRRTYGPDAVEKAEKGLWS